MFDEHGHYDFAADFLSFVMGARARAGKLTVGYGTGAWEFEFDFHRDIHPALVQWEIVS